MKIEKMMPTTWLLIAMLAMLTLHFVAPVRKIIPPGWNLLGLGMIINESSALVTDDAFHVTRNPMYLGFVLTLIEIAVLVRSLTPYAVILPGGDARSL
jgi:protein-S-isoprenylcysteine O-methyltransferase Ste14